MNPTDASAAAESAPERLFRTRAVAVTDLLDLDEVRILDDPQACAAEPAFYWEHPGADEAWFALGAVASFVASGPERLATVRAAARAALARALPAPGETAAPRVVGGFAFAPGSGPDLRWREFPPAWFFLPRRLWLRSGRRCTVIECIDAPVSTTVAAAAAAAPAAPEADETEARWFARVRAALHRIDGGELDKIVLSRSRRIPAARPPLLDVLRRLRQLRPECVTFACKPGATTWFGSTPELLVERQEDAFFSPALAGTVRRSGDPRVDGERGRALRLCPKNRREHAAVVDGIRAALRPLGVRLDPPQEPHLFALPEALHLRTPITGHGAAEHDVLALAAALHPTPAVCGTPREAAAALLHAEEPGRGWYTGGVGWMDAAGDGEVVVALRSGLLADDALTLFAGAGVVAGSEPRAEFEETETKMGALLGPLRAAGCRCDGSAPDAEAARA